MGHENLLIGVVGVAAFVLGFIFGKKNGADVESRVKEAEHKAELLVGEARKKAESLASGIEISLAGNLARVEKALTNHATLASLTMTGLQSQITNLTQTAPTPPPPDETTVAPRA